MRLLVSPHAHALAECRARPIKVKRSGIVVLCAPPCLKPLKAVEELDQPVDVASLRCQAEYAGDLCQLRGAGDRVAIKLLFLVNRAWPVSAL